MPGLYSIATRAPGTLITALIYNSDHQAHVDGRAAEFMQSYSVSLAQMNITEDPLPKEESLPVTLAGEIARLRFDIAAIKTTLNGDAPTQWYTPVTTPAFPAFGARVQRQTIQVIPDGVSTAVNFLASANVDFNSGSWSSANPTRFTAQATGKYYVAACVKWDGDNNNERRQLSIRLTPPGTTDFAQTSTTGSLGTDMFQCVASIIELDATDYVEFLVLQDTGADLNLLVDDEQAPVGSMIYFGSNP